MSKAISLPDVSDLRQKPPFLFVERVESLDQENGSIVALLARGDGRSFTSLECVPAFMLLEALAQTGGILSRSLIGPARRGYVASFESVRFEEPSPLSSAEVVLRVQLDESMHPFFSLSFSACCSDRLLAEGRMCVYTEF